MLGGIGNVASTGNGMGSAHEPALASMCGNVLSEGPVQRPLHAMYLARALK